MKVPPPVVHNSGANQCSNNPVEKSCDNLQYADLGVTGRKPEQLSVNTRKSDKADSDNKPGVVRVPTFTGKATVL